MWTSDFATRLRINKSEYAGVSIDWKKGGSCCYKSLGDGNPIVVIMWCLVIAAISGFHGDLFLTLLRCDFCPGVS